MYEVGQHIIYPMGCNQAIDEDRAATGDLDFEFHAVILRVDGRYLKVRLINEPFRGEIEWMSQLPFRRGGAEKGAKPFDGSITFLTVFDISMPFD